MMDTFFKQNDASAVKEALLSQLALAVKEVQANVLDLELVESNTDNTASFLLTVIEAIFIHGLKETLLNRMSQVINSDIGQRPEPNFWAPLLVFSHRDVIRQISGLSQVTTDVGRGRAWLRLALNEGLLSSYIYSMLADNASLKPYYNNVAFLRDSEKIDVAKQLVEGIEGCKFSFACNSSLLNVWTNMPLLMAAVSTGPLRSCPVVPGTDVAQTLLSDEPSTPSNKTKSSAISIYSYSDHVKRSTLMVDEDEALKIILGTPVNESPLQAKINSRENCEEALMSITDTNNESKFENSLNDSHPVNQPSSNIKQPHENALPNQVESPGSSVSINENVREELKSASLPSLMSTSQQSYNSLLRSYNKVPGTNLKSNLKLMQQYDRQLKPAECISEDPPTNSAESDIPEMVLSANSGFDFEIIPAAYSISNVIPEYTCLVQYLSVLAKEQGLDAQKYSCSYCKNPVGVNLENVRFCSFTGEYYCKECYGCPTEEWIIPARVIHNWDFRKYPISQRAEKFLAEIQDHPIIDLKAINPRLYVVIDEMAQLQTLRMQLNLLRGYLFTCRQPVGESLKRQIWPKEYLYEHVHLYSVSDLIKIPSGALIHILEKAVNFSRTHVLACSLCKEKGFICEICSVQTVIYPFDLDSTYKCRICNAVYHAQCLNRNKPCPKCERYRRRHQQDSPVV